MIAQQIINGISNMLLKCGAITLENAKGLDGALNTKVKEDIEEYAKEYHKMMEEKYKYALLGLLNGARFLQDYYDEPGIPNRLNLCSNCELPIIVKTD